MRNAKAERRELSAILSVTGPSGTTTFAYNGLGDRLQETVNGVTTTFTMDLAAGLTQVLSDGTYSYLYGAGRIAQVSSTGREYFLGDALGSVRQLADEGGEVVRAAFYSPYGEVLSTAGAAQTSFGYTGEQQDASGRVYLRARMYEPSMGRFMTRDSWGGNDKKPISYNGWLYGDGNPIFYADPSGHSAIVKFTSDGIQNWTQTEKDVVEAGAQDVANAYAKLINSYSLYVLQYNECYGSLFFVLMNKVTPDSIFNIVHDGPITFHRSSEQVYWMGKTFGKNLIKFYNHIAIYQDEEGHNLPPIVQKLYLPTYPRIVVHEIGHAFDDATKNLMSNTLKADYSSLLRPLDEYGSIEHVDNSNPNHPRYYGYAGNVGYWQFGWDGDRSQEEFADMFVGWTYNTWSLDPYPGNSPYNNRSSVMNSLMLKGLISILANYYHFPVRVGNRKPEPIFY
jgi:RHS repeat-associated protein